VFAAFVMRDATILACVEFRAALLMSSVVLAASVMFPTTIVILAFVDLRSALLVPSIVFPTFVVFLAAVVIFALVDFRIAVPMSFLVLATFIVLLAFVMAVTLVAPSFAFRLTAVAPLAFGKKIGCAKQCDAQERAKEVVQKTSTKLEFHRSTSSDFFRAKNRTSTGQPHFFPSVFRNPKQEFANRTTGVVTHRESFCEFLSKANALF